MISEEFSDSLETQTNEIFHNIEPLNVTRLWHGGPVTPPLLVHPRHLHTTTTLRPEALLHLHVVGALPQNSIHESNLHFFLFFHIMCQLSVAVDGLNVS